MDVLFGEEAGPETDFLRSLIIEETERAVADLPEEQRIVFGLSGLFDVPVKEIAKRIGTPVNIYGSYSAVSYLIQWEQV